MVCHHFFWKYWGVPWKYLLEKDGGIEIMSKFFAMSAQCLVAAGRSAFTLYSLCWEFFQLGRFQLAGERVGNNSLALASERWMYIQRYKFSSHVLFPYWVIGSGKFSIWAGSFSGCRMGWETVYYIALTDLHRMQCWKHSYNTLRP